MRFWECRSELEKKVLSADAQAILKIMRREWEMASRDLREESGIGERARFDKAMTQFQRTLKLFPTEVLYEPTFTYIWSIPEARFADQLQEVVEREAALKEIARAYLVGAGMTLRGELARVTGLRAPEAGLGNWGLVDEGFADRLAPGVYRLSSHRFRQIRTAGLIPTLIRSIRGYGFLFDIRFTECLLLQLRNLQN